MGSKRGEGGGWKRIDTHPVIAQAQPDTWTYQKEIEDGHLTVLTTPALDDTGFHLSISHRLSDGTRAPGRYPSWDEIKEARYRFCPPNSLMAMLLPEESEYVNFHETTFHLWEITKPRSTNA